VDIKLFDINGAVKRSLISAEFNAGSHTNKADVSKMQSGVYIYQLVTQTSIVNKKIMLLGR